jgi:anti-sigma factor RsiW
MVELTPCDHWKEKLSMTHFKDLSPSENAELTTHLVSCPACASVRENYHEVDAILRSLPPIEPLPGLPPRVLQLWEEEDRRNTSRHPRVNAHSRSASLDISQQLKGLRAESATGSRKKADQVRSRIIVFVIRNGLRIVLAISTILISPLLH